MEMTKEDWKHLQNGSDIRGVAIKGVVGEVVNLTAQVAFAIGAGFASWLAEKKQKNVNDLHVAIGHDSRLSGKMLQNALASGLKQSGCRISSFGLASTPAMFMATVQEGYDFDGSVMITASHLPFNRNGFKFFTSEGGLEKADISSILNLAAEVDSPSMIENLYLDTIDFMAVYAQNLLEIIRKGANDPDHYETPLAGLKILVDAGNGAGGYFADKVLLPLGADITGSQFLDPDGSFPNHIPNPENREAMESVRQAVLDNKADLGIIFDTDVDRAGAVDAEGNEINRNRIIALMAAILLEEHPGTTIVTDSITSDELAAFIKGLGGVHHRFKRGYRNVINESVRLNKAGTDSQLAIETSGHGALKENYFLDDGAYMIAKILIKTAKLHREGKSIASLLSELQDPAEASEFRLRITSENFKATGESVLFLVQKEAATRPAWQVVPDNYEGIRVSFDKAHGDGWFLLRMSLHDPIMPLNIESRQDGGVRLIADQLLEVLTKVEGLDLSLLQA